MPDPATTAALLQAASLVAQGRSGDGAPAGAGGFNLGPLGDLVGGLNRVKSKDRPIAETDLQKLLFDVQARPFAYDEPAEFDRLIRINRPGARQQISTALRTNRLSIFGPPPQLMASTAPLPPLSSSPPLTGPFDPRLPVPVPRQPMQIPRGGPTAVGIVLLENLYRLYESTEAEIARLEAETARMGETEAELKKRIKARERELRREQKAREREIRRREKELGRERRKLEKAKARKARERITDVADVMRALPGRNRRIAKLPVRIRERDVVPSVPFTGPRPSVAARVGAAATRAAALVGPFSQRIGQARQFAQLLGLNRQRGARAPVAAGFAVPAAPAPVVSLAPAIAPASSARAAPAFTDPAVQRCVDRASKPKKKRKPRDVCYRGSYTETRTGVRKRRREKIPCD